MHCCMHGALKTSVWLCQVFEMFSYVQLEGDPQGVPPAHPPPGWKDAFSARHKVAGTMVSYARSASQVETLTS